MQKLPQFENFTHCKRLIDSAWQNPNQRPGQALSSKFQFPKELEDKIYEEPDFNKVVQRVWNYCNRPEYQNR